MFDQLGEGVYRRRYESLDLNVGVVMGDDGLLIVDTRASHRQADELRDELRALSPNPVRWVINTHWHWDHTFGNAVFGTADIWGHQNCLVALRDRGDEMKTSAKTWIPQEYHPVIDEVEITPPKSTFAERASLSGLRRWRVFADDGQPDPPFPPVGRAQAEDGLARISHRFPAADVAKRTVTRRTPGGPLNVV